MGLLDKFRNKDKAASSGTTSVSPTSPRTGSSATQPTVSVPGVEDPFAALRRYDTVFIVDDSGSMNPHWKKTRDALIGVVEKSVQYDDDGIDVVWFNHRESQENVTTASSVKNLFKKVTPRGTTPTATALKKVTEPYLRKLEEAHRAKNAEKGGNAVAPIKLLNIVVLTDGAPNSGEEPESVIVDVAKRLDAIRAPLNQLGFSFVQIGTDEKAQDALTHLDDDLKTKHGIRDIVDTTLSPRGGDVTTDYLLKALLGGVNRKLDKQI